MTWREPTLSFKCGACGTEATGFIGNRFLVQFAQEHAKVCPGFPPVRQADKERE